MDGKPDPVWATIKKTDDPREFLLAVMNNDAIDMSARIEAADALMPYYHERLAAEDDEQED
ncbi:hypothetical protein B0G75_117123 [Paraburkholderia sp. BL18I3N2]|uniref:hypothetical protein n=1 Tax=Paraburkholderia sp. BL18I3N2 TaxID=1938799 RepID=UPI000D08340D|nr:hypothetical protein [Paraburkholderia sp. BL18I3N2]PRX26839.1 hypothetical protein B0G75_117123 [Paraburkholderia sp. BL18I3N2]